MSPQTTAHHIGVLGGGDPIDVAQAYAAGITRSQIRAAIAAGMVAQVRHGVISVSNLGEGTPRDHDLHRIRALLSRVDSDLVISHESAAVLHRLPTAPGENQGVIHLTSLRKRRLRLPGAIVHAARGDLSDHVTEVEGIPVVSRLRTGIDLARGKRLSGALISLDAAVRRDVIEDPRTYMLPHDDERAECIPVVKEVLASVRAQVRSLHHCTGIDGLRFAATVTSPLSESPLESASRGEIIDAGFDPPALQYRYTDADGRHRRADLLLAEGLIGEADGMVKYEGTAGAERLKAEKLRDLAAAEVGLRTLRWSAADVWTRRDEWIRHLRREIYAARSHRNPLTKWSA